MSRQFNIQMNDDFGIMQQCIVDEITSVDISFSNLGDQYCKWYFKVHDVSWAINECGYADKFWKNVKTEHEAFHETIIRLLGV